MDPKNASTKPGSTVLDGKYVLKEKVGNGSFGQIHIAVSKEDGTVVAIKLERKIANVIMTLARESKILKELRGETGFPTVYDYGTDNSYNYLVLDLLGLDLEKLFKSCNYKFSLKTALLIAEQMLTRIESLHKKGYIHRDIKPENFCISKGSNGELHLIDFGLARSYKDVHGKHIPCSQKKGLIGTARYASINNHLGLEQSRRDDLEAIGYTMIYLMKGVLPWQNLKATTKQEKYELIANLKLTTPIPVLCKDLPTEFLTYMNYVRSLDFVETPDYKYLKGLFRALFLKSGFDYDYGYDWLKFKKKEDLGSLDKLPRKQFQGPGEVKIPMSPSKEHIIFESNLKNLANLAQRPKPSGVNSNQRQPRPSIEYSPYKLIVSKELIDSNNELADKNDTQNKIIGDMKQFISKTHGKINGFTSREDNQSKTNFLYSENSPRNISTSSEHSSKMINVSKTKFDDDDVAIDIPIELTGDIPTPSSKIKETTPLQAKTKNSYYISKNQDLLQPGTAREDVRKRTFIRTYSARPSTSTDAASLKKKVIAPPIIKERLPPPREEIKLETEDQGENLNESSIGEWAQHSPMNYMMNQRAFMTNNKNF